MKRILFLLGIGLSLIPLSYSYGATAPMMLAANTQNTFAGSINDFIRAVLSSNNDIRCFSWGWLGVLTTLAAFNEFTRFVNDGFDAEKILVCVILIITTTYLCTHFIEPMDVIWQSANAISLSFLEGVTGNRDPLYLTKWLNHTLYRLVIDDPSLMLDTGYVIIMALLWEAAIALVTLMMYLVGIWATWGFALSKLLAMLFIPCLVYPPTRGYFDAFFKFFLGFVILLLVMRITGAIAALTLQAQFQTLGLTCSSVVSCAIRDGTEVNPTMQLTMIITCFLCTLLVASSFKFAYELAGVCGSASGGAVGSLTSLVKKGLTKLK
ncbi:type IV secretion system protein [Vibrio algivorus]|uniref:Type IV secretion system protein n=1 Tax=Vibrio algivorus TaxID=1667024 RepID=A0A557PGZ6_9VIBR|nr:type IV secretion system protein [Vibrio algivorus]TVO39928.1 hypothetical protein FOF44_00220 [Vibrio algivorus]